MQELVDAEKTYADIVNATLPLTETPVLKCWGTSRIVWDIDLTAPLFEAQRQLIEKTRDAALRNLWSTDARGRL